VCGFLNSVRPPRGPENRPARRAHRASACDTTRGVINDCGYDTVTWNRHLDDGRESLAYGPERPRGGERVTAAAAIDAAAALVGTAPRGLVASHRGEHPPGARRSRRDRRPDRRHRPDRPDARAGAA